MRGDSTMTQDTDLIHHEIQSLELLSRQLFMELDDLQAERDRLRYAKTWRGKYFNVLGYIFSVYCSYKLIMVRVSYCRVLCVLFHLSHQH